MAAITPEPLPNPLVEMEGAAPPTDNAKPDPNEIAATLESYRQEADSNRKVGMNPRDQKWKENIDLYYGRYNFSKKMQWQAKEVMPEVANFVDRFAAAMKEALVTGESGFYDVVDPSDKEQDLANVVKRMLNVWLGQTGRNQMGTCLGFPAVFEEQCKLGAMMACASVVNWKDDVPNGRVAIETVDPRFIWMDHTYRDMYRIRRVELDRHDLQGMVKLKDSKGKPIFNLEGLNLLITGLEATDNLERARLSGSGANIASNRIPVTLDEYYATVLNKDGTVLYDKALCVVANQRYLVRGPETNPFWHGNDWVTYAPLVTVPLSVYGRSYMEDFSSVAKTFNELTNMILDAVHTSSLRAFAVVPGILRNPEQITEGLTPNKLFFLEEGNKPEDFAKALELGQLPPEAVQVWSSIKQELREAGNMNEIGLGQMAPKGRTSATEISTTMESSSSVIRGVAQTIETRWLDPTLDLVWKTGLQHMKQDDKMLANAAGEDMFGALWGRRKELAKRSLTFRAQGISRLIQKSRMLKALLSALQIIASNELLMQEFLKEADIGKLVKMIFELSDIDMEKMTLSARDEALKNMTQQMQGAAGNPMDGTGQPPQVNPAAHAPGTTVSPQTPREMRNLAASMGVQRGP